MQENKEMETLLRESLKSEDIPSIQLQKRVVHALYAREERKTRRISLWYLPMALNSMISFLGIVCVRLLLPDVLLSRLLIAACLYLMAAGIILTAAGVKLTDFKEKTTVELKRKRRIAG